MYKSCTVDISSGVEHLFSTYWSVVNYNYLNLLKNKQTKREEKKKKRRGKKTNRALNIRIRLDYLLRSRAEE